VLACGGTGGHLYPGIAVARAFQRSDAGAEILFVGTRNGMESKIIPEKGFPFAAVVASGFVGKGIPDRVRSIGRVLRGGAQALGLLRRFAPSLVIGVGGYASVPVILAAALLRIPRVLLEPNVRPGLANRLLAPFSSLIVAAFEGTRRHLRSNRVQVLGVPIRPELLSRGQRPPGKTGQTLLILGGSQGAQSINDAMIGALPLLEGKKARPSIIHQTGEKDFEKVRRSYQGSGLRARVEPFIEEMAGVYAEADLVIGRSGAATLAELTVLGLPSILIPFPYAAGHQEDNAREIEAAGGAKVLLQRDLTPERLAAAIFSLLEDPAALSKMAEASRRLGKPNAAEQIVAACVRLIAA
jgi:UDP-N-acetylglucosamine--N-acetylmuramyl-(pentapeptide) pyrophosphoryl-undecaprenol N-acetylglucosamine transferase